MKKTFYFLILLLGLTFVHAQTPEKIPDFIQEIRKEHPNFYKAAAMFQVYMDHVQDSLKRHPESLKKEFSSIYEKEYKEWSKLVQPYTDENGEIHMPTIEDIKREARKNERKHRALSQAYNTNPYYSEIPYHTTWSPWSYEGPVKLYKNKATHDKDYNNNTANVRAFVQSKSNPDHLYSAVENGTIYVSKNKGHTWHYATQGYNIKGVTAINVSPTNSDYAYAANGYGVYKTSDGGLSWTLLTSPLFTPVTSPLGNEANKILVIAQDTNPENDIVLFASKRGLFKITKENTEYIWKRVGDSSCLDIVQKYNSTELYTLLFNSDLNLVEFYSSTDLGNTFQKKAQNGWYDPADDGLTKLANISGARLAVSESNPEVIYAYIIASRFTDDNGYLGVYRSNDGGVNWVLPNTFGPGKGSGGYNDTTNKNLATMRPTQTYHQGFYNCAIIVHPKNENEIIVGGLNTFKSTDGGGSFTPVGGYLGPFPIHPDAQTFYVQSYPDGTMDTWLTTDGTINYSTDFFNDLNNHEFRAMGLTGDFWGFDVGEYNDFLVGGTYHNGNKASIEDFGKGNYIAIGGGESSTGYILPFQNERYMYHSDVGGRLISKTILEGVSVAPEMNPKPTEPYAGRTSTIFTQRSKAGYTYYRTITNLGTSSDVNFYRIDPSCVCSQHLSTFNNGKLANENQLAVSFQDPRYMYWITNNNEIYASEDEGQTWSYKGTPWPGNKGVVRIAIDGKDPKTIYAILQGGITADIPVSHDQGSTFSNITRPVKSISFKEIIPIRSMPESFIIVGQNKSEIYMYQNKTWENISYNLPTNLSILEPKIQYRKGILYIATKGDGIWKLKIPEENLNIDPIELNIHTPTQRTYNKQFIFNFIDQTFYYGKDIASWKWEFPGAEKVTNADTRTPEVAYNKYGRFTVKLTATDSKGIVYTKSWYNYITIFPYCNCTMPESLAKHANNVSLWFDGSDSSSLIIKDKISGDSYGINGNIEVTNSPAMYNNQPYYNIKATNSYISFNKMVNAKTVFIVSNLDPNITSDFTFILGHTHSTSFHSGGKLGPIISSYYGNGRLEYDVTNGAATRIDNVNYNFKATNFRTEPAIYTLRVKQNSLGMFTDNFSKDRTYSIRTWLGGIAEILAFDIWLDDTEIDEIYQYLKSKYNL